MGARGQNYPGVSMCPGSVSNSLIISFNSHVSPLRYHEPCVCNVMLLRLQINKTPINVACIIMTFIISREGNPGVDEVTDLVELTAQGLF